MAIGAKLRLRRESSTGSGHLGRDATQPQTLRFTQGDTDPFARRVIYLATNSFDRQAQVTAA